MNGFGAIAAGGIMLFTVNTAGASLIQDFTFTGSDVNGIGTVTFAADNTTITNVDYEGTARGEPFSRSGISGTGSLTGWNIVDWNWVDLNFSAAPQSSTLSFTASGPATLVAECTAQTLSACNKQIGTQSNTMTVTFFPQHDVPEPGTLALFGIGIAGLGFARRRKAAA